MTDSHTTLVIRETLTRILDSEQFASSPQMSAFLRYVVEEAVAGNTDRIKAYSVAVDALGKPGSFDAQKNPCVRVLALRLRESLADYYQTSHEAVVITIPRGSYKPIFAFSKSDLQDVDTCFDGGAIASGVDCTLAKAADVRAGERAVEPSSATHQPGNASDRPGPSESVSAALPSYAPRTFHRLPSRQGLGVFLVLALGIWGVLHSLRAPSYEDPSQASVDQLPQDPALGSDVQAESMINTAASTRTRPDMPTVHIYASPDSDELIQQLGIVMGGAVAKFSNIVVIRDQNVIRKKDAWPEDYEFRGNAVRLDNQIRVITELVHMASGTIAHSTSIELPQDGDTLLTPRVIEIIEAVSAQLALLHGPLINDYRQREGIRPELDCLYNVQDQLYQTNNQTADADQSRDHWAVEAAAQMETCGVTSWPLNHQHTSSIILSARIKLKAATHMTSARERQVLLDDAVALAERAASLRPYQAETHGVLMRALRLSGDLERAEVEGSKALQLNRLDSAFLHDYADLLSEMGLNERSATVVAKADKLDPINRNWR